MGSRRSGSFASYNQYDSSNFRSRHDTCRSGYSGTCLLSSKVRLKTQKHEVT